MPKKLLIIALLLLAADPAAAAITGTGAPWEEGFGFIYTSLKDNILPTALGAAVIAVGLFWAFTNHGQGISRLIQVVFGGAIAVGGLTLLGLFGISAAMI